MVAAPSAACSSSGNAPKHPLAMRLIEEQGAHAPHQLELRAVLLGLMDAHVPRDAGRSRRIVNRDQALPGHRSPLLHGVIKSPKGTQSSQS